MSQRFCFLKMLVFAALVTVYVSGAWANVVISTVTVGNAGNAPDTRYNSVAVGGVSYTYNIGKYEVTTGQYAAFLHAVAATDTYGLYSTYMDYISESGYAGCNIKRSGSSGSYTYAVGNGSPADVAKWANRPVNWVSWGDAARFANWMHNGQPAGGQNLATTEDGSYFLNGATSNPDLTEVTRKAGATWVIASEDEWYKAAYHKNDGVTGNYWDYPTGTNAEPSNGNPEGDTGNSANFWDGSDYTIDSPYNRTNVGFFGFSHSPYGTFDQGGNVCEWNDAAFGSYSRGLRGGSFAEGGYLLNAMFRGSRYADYEFHNIGFRVALVPEPAMIVMLALGGLGMLRRR